MSNNPEAASAAAGLAPDRLQRITRWLQEQVTAERLAGAGVLLGRRGKVGYFETTGFADKEAQKSFERDTLVRIFSMSKPITTVAAMMLYERGLFQLDDALTRWLPEFTQTEVWVGGDADIATTVPVEQPITIRQVMTHTAGFTYGFMHTNVVDAAYREHDIEFPGASGTLAQSIERLAELPLICQPGSQWNYSVASDVLGRLVEVWSGMSLADFFQQEIFTPLKMTSTGFHVEADNHDRFSSLYGPMVGGDMSSVASAKPAVEAEQRGGLKLLEGSAKSRYLQPATLYSGGGGLTGSMSDYGRFCQMLLNGGELVWDSQCGVKRVTMA